MHCSIIDCIGNRHVFFTAFYDNYLGYLINIVTVGLSYRMNKMEKGTFERTSRRSMGVEVGYCAPAGREHDFRHRTAAVDEDGAVTPRRCLCQTLRASRSFSAPCSSGRRPERRVRTRMFVTISPAGGVRAPTVSCSPSIPGDTMSR